MHLGEELVILGVLFLIAYVLGRLGKLVGLPTIPIYMLVGLIASPNFDLFPLDFAAANVELIAVFGLIFLLFSLGLEFDQDEFYGNLPKLLITGGTRILINFGFGFAFGLWLGWGTREALIVAGMTGVSSSAIITKLLIELRRLPNRESPVILGVMVLEDVFVALYLAIVSVIIGGQTDLWPIIGELAISFGFLIVMFTLARWGGRFISRLVNSKDDELFTILCFGLAVAFGGIGEQLGVSDAIGAFVIGLVLGATRFRARIEQFALPLRDVFGAFFFLNFGLALDPSTFGEVLWPVVGAVVMTLIINTLGGQLIAWQNGFTAAQGFNASAMLQNRGEFALILATLAIGAGLDPRLQPFAGLYVLTMAIIGPLLAVNSERIGSLLKPRRKKSPAEAQRDVDREESIALVEAALTEPEPAPEEDQSLVPSPDPEFDPVAAMDAAEESDAIVEQAAQQSDERGTRPRDPEY